MKMQSWRKKMEITNVPIKDLKPNEKNPRKQVEVDTSAKKTKRTVLTQGALKQ